MPMSVIKMSSSHRVVGQTQDLPSLVSMPASESFQLSVDLAMDKTMSSIAYGAVAFLGTFYAVGISETTAVNILCMIPPPNPSFCSNEHVITII